MKKPLIILTGPTAVGKTELSIRLARLINGSVISADSMQVYRHMDIGSAKITKEEMQEIPHYLIDEFEPDEEFHVVRFQEYAQKYMQKIYAGGRIPIIVGGTGFYIQALLYDIDFTQEQGDTCYRAALEKLAKERGGNVLHETPKPQNRFMKTISNVWCAHWNFTTPAAERFLPTTRRNGRRSLPTILHISSSTMTDKSSTNGLMAAWNR